MVKIAKVKSEWIQGLKVKLANHEKGLLSLKKHWESLNNDIKHEIREVESRVPSTAKGDYDALAEIADAVKLARVAELAKDYPRKEISETKSQDIMETCGKRSKVIKRAQNQRRKDSKKLNYHRVFISEVFDLGK